MIDIFLERATNYTEVIINFNSEDTSVYNYFRDNLLTVIVSPSPSNNSLEFICNAAKLIDTFKNIIDNLDESSARMLATNLTDWGKYRSVKKTQFSFSPRLKLNSSALAPIVNNAVSETKKSEQSTLPMPVPASQSASALALSDTNTSRSTFNVNAASSESAANASTSERPTSKSKKLSASAASFPDPNNQNNKPLPQIPTPPSSLPSNSSESKSSEPQKNSTIDSITISSEQLKKELDSQEPTSLELALTTAPDAPKAKKIIDTLSNNREILIPYLNRPFCGPSFKGKPKTNTVLYLLHTNSTSLLGNSLKTLSDSEIANLLSPDKAYKNILHDLIDSIKDEQAIIKCLATLRLLFKNPQEFKNYLNSKENETNILEFALQQKMSIKIIEWLLDQGAETTPKIIAMVNDLDHHMSDEARSCINSRIAYADYFAVMLEKFSALTEEMRKKYSATQQELIRFLNNPDMDGNTPIMRAFIRGDIASAQKMMSVLPDDKARRAHLEKINNGNILFKVVSSRLIDDTLCHKAIECILSYFTDDALKKAYANRICNHQTALMRATQCNASTVTIMTLIQAGADPNLMCDNKSALLLALKHNPPVPYLEYLLKLTKMKLIDHALKTHPQHQALITAKYRLIAAAGEGNIATVKRCIALGDDINVEKKEEEKRETPLLAAVKENHPEVVKILLGITDEQKSDEQHTHLTIPNKSLHDALILAIQQINLPLTKLLLHEGKANPNIPNQLGHLALFEAIEHTSDIEVVRLLIASGANVDARAMNHKTPLLTALELKNEKSKEGMVKLLCEHKADVSLEDGDSDCTPLMKAAEIGSLNCVKIIMEAIPLENRKEYLEMKLGDPLEKQSRFNAIDLAATKGHVQVVRYLRGELEQLKNITNPHASSTSTSYDAIIAKKKAEIKELEEQLAALTAKKGKTSVLTSVLVDGSATFKSGEKTKGKKNKSETIENSSAPKT